MTGNYVLHAVKTEPDIGLFWQLRDAYMREDILPNATFNPTTAEEYEYFFLHVIYHTEDGKCFIIDFCINSSHRNKGLGSLFFTLLREYVTSEHATYCALNLSNEKNERFWTRHGFIKAAMDEYGNYVYERRPI